MSFFPFQPVLVDFNVRLHCSKGPVYWGEYETVPLKLGNTIKPQLWAKWRRLERHYILYLMPGFIEHQLSQNHSYHTGFYLFNNTVEEFKFWR